MLTAALILSAIAHLKGEDDILAVYASRSTHEFLSSIAQMERMPAEAKRALSSLTFKVRFDDALPEGKAMVYTTTDLLMLAKGRGFIG